MLRLLLLVFTVSGTSVNAQSVVPATVVVQQGTPTLITLTLDAVSVEAALKAVARQAGLQLAVDRSVIPKKLVTVKLDAMRVDDALRQVLSGTNLVAHVRSSGMLSVVERDVARDKRSGQGVITGRIIDAKSGKGIAGANISLGSDTRSVTSNDDGTYRLAGVAAGSQTVAVRLVGYAKQTRSVSITDNSTVTVDFKLEPSANVLDQVVVTGTVAQTELKAVPNAITVITAKQIEDRGITHIDQLFRGEIPGLFAMNLGSSQVFDEVIMFSRGATALRSTSAGTANGTNPIKTYVDGVEMADAKYLSQIDPTTIERIEILTGPQASTIYGSNALNGVMQIFTKRGTSSRPQVALNHTSGFAQNKFNSSMAPSHVSDAAISGIEGRFSYNIGGSWNYLGAWTPSRRSQRVGVNGGSRFDVGKLTVDVSGRQGITVNKARGGNTQGSNELRLNGVWIPNPNAYLLEAKTSTLTGRTTGLSIGYRPLSWWSHDIVFGSDANTTESYSKNPNYNSTGSDTLRSASTSNSYRSSQRYTSTLQIPMSDRARLTMTAGGDHWRTSGSSWSGNVTSLNGTLSPAPSVTRTHPGKNHGGFVQGQLGLYDALFLVYGLRAEWNPNYGEDAQPNVAPRYGVSYSRDVGPVSAKVRASYGRSTRPPQEQLKLAAKVTPGSSLITAYGEYDQRLANPELTPEDQQGGEGGIELYWGNRGSLVVTRYNQTVNKLISSVAQVDSVRSLELIGSPTILTCVDNGSQVPGNDGYCYRFQSQYLNVGSIRNQGWELQGSINTGPLITRGTYSWTKSRVIGITKKYKDLLDDADFQPGRPVDFVPEHTWSVGTTYTRAASSLNLTLNGTGTYYRTVDDLSLAVISTIRLRLGQPVMVIPTGYRGSARGYAIADLNASQRFNSRVTGVLQIQNLNDYYKNDNNDQYSVVGRQSKLGIRIHM